MLIEWGTKTITVYQADSFMTNLGGGIYEMDTDAFRLALKDREDDEDGIPHLDTHLHYSEVTVGGVTLAHVLVIINGYSITFEDGQYAVELRGTNNNIPDVANVNQVSLRSFNSAGLVVTGESGLTAQEAADLAAAAADAAKARKASINRAVISSDDQTVTIYDDDKVTPLFVFDVSSDKRERDPQ
ncbi:MAG: hypothetical protein AMS19_02530 [Gemmatimonas sp. SG8_23]|jgi:hypothetical protein|nr:MAG: hypothetical protein AMS19_02530 [Gemmatimonas sp. SG8_23]